MDRPKVEHFLGRVVEALCSLDPEALTVTCVTFDSCCSAYRISLQSSRRV